MIADAGAQFTRPSNAVVVDRERGGPIFIGTVDASVSRRQEELCSAGKSQRRQTVDGP